MAKHNRFQGSAEGTVPEAITSDTPATPQGNFTLTFRRTHPKDRASYGVDGNSGIVVFDRNLLLGGDAPDFEWPKVIVIDAALVLVKLDNKTAKAEAMALKAAEKERKAAEKLAAAQAKVAAKQAEAQAKLEAAQAKLAAAAAKAAAPTV